MKYTNNNYSNIKPGMPSYWGNSLLKPRPFYDTGFEDSLEKIVFKEEPEQEKGILESVFSDKSKTLKATIKALFNEINLRKGLDYDLIKRTDEDICRQHSHLEQVKTLMQFNYSTNFLNYSSKARMQTEKNVLDLEQEKRKEYLECWKDLFELKKELLSSLKDYWLISKRKHSLNLENDRCGEYMSEIETYNWQ